MLILHLIATSVMVGVIWIIQLVHYPSFHFIELKQYTTFQRFHMSRISYVVIPAMLTELFTLILIIISMDQIDTLVLASAILLIFIWLITAVFFSGVHQKLTLGYDQTVVDKLVKLNWGRTLLWTLRLLFISIYML
jgi:hypothetical protein|tara:strand:+ start:969 stop:1376 length:408 start_codon:yes stop_codon:yes gene_type:complete